MSDTDPKDQANTMKPTEPQRRELQYAADNHFGLTYSAVPINGPGASAKRRMMERMCRLGWFKPYVHSGWEITEAGRKSLNLANSDQQERT